MLRAFRLWLHSFNPIAIWIEQKRLDREAQLQIVGDVCDALREQSKVAIKALDLSTSFLQSFHTTEPPSSYVVRDDDEVKAAAARLGIDLNDYADGEDPFRFI